MFYWSWFSCTVSTIQTVKVNINIKHVDNFLMYGATTKYLLSRLDAIDTWALCKKMIRGLLNCEFTITNDLDWPWQRNFSYFSPCVKCGSQRNTGCSPLSHLVTGRHLRLFGHIARSLSREDHARALAVCIRQVPPKRKRPAGRPSHNWPWPSELWPCDCQEKGHYSRRMATYCGHSNASVEYALKKEFLPHD